MIEMLIVVVIGSMLLTIAMPAFGRMQARFGAIGARDAFLSLAARARGEAIYRGADVELVVDEVTEQVVVRVRDTGSEIERMDFASEYEADVKLSRNDDSITLCYGSRGITRDGCNDLANAPDTVAFVLGAGSARAEVRALGQVRGL